MDQIAVKQVAQSTIMSAHFSKAMSHGEIAQARNASFAGSEGAQRRNFKVSLGNKGEINVQSGEFNNKRIDCLVAAAVVERME